MKFISRNPRFKDYKVRVQSQDGEGGGGRENVANILNIKKINKKLEKMNKNLLGAERKF